MNSAEQKLFSDVVKLVNRTDRELEFKWDAVTYTIPGGKDKFLPRHIAMQAVKMNNTKIDAETGLIMESLFGIDEADTFYPCDKIGGIDLEQIKEMPKLDTDQEELKTMKSSRVPGAKRRKNMTGATV